MGSFSIQDWIFGW